MNNALPRVWCNKVGKIPMTLSSMPTGVWPSHRLLCVKCKAMCTRPSSPPRLSHARWRKPDFAEELDLEAEALRAKFEDSILVR